MRYYIKADLLRIAKRIPRYIILVLGLAAFAAIMLTAADGKSVYEIVDTVTDAMPYVCVLFGIIEFAFVYTDDLKAKTMQIAIGHGISRSQVVMAKWIEHTLMCLLDCVLIVIEILICSAIRGAMFSGEPAADVFLLMLFGVIKVIGATGITMIVVFATMNPVLSIITYICASIGIVNMIFSIILTIGPLENLNLDRFLFSTLLETARSRALVGTVSIGHLIGVVIYLAAFYFITVKIFEKRELEF